MGWLIALAVLIGLAILPLGASVIYNTDGPLIRLIAGPLRIQIIPAKKKEKKPKKEKKEPKTKKEKKPAEPKPPKEKKKEPSQEGGSILDFLPLVQVALDFLGDFRRKLRLKHLVLRLTMAGGDPCDLAVNYGKAWAAVGGIMPYLEKLFVIGKRDIEVQCDFVSDKTVIYARLDISITLGRILSLLVRYAIRALREYLKIMKLRKGGANK